MKKCIAMLCMCAFLAGCGTLAKQSEFWDHDSVYKNWSHLKYSWVGYKIPTPEKAKQSHDQEWWGITIK